MEVKHNIPTGSLELKEVIEKKGTKMTFRPDIKVMDCTLRDGGLINNFRFSDQLVKSLYQACIDSGVDYMELGYKSSKKIFSISDFGSLKFCSEEDISRIIGDNISSNLKLSVMADTGRTDYHEDIPKKSESIIDMIRVAAYAHQIPAAIEIIKDAHDKGYETTINIMAVSNVMESELNEALEILSLTEVNIIYLVDSFGAFYSEEIRDLAYKYLSYARDAGKKIGIHTHNNQQLAYANTLEALILGVSYLDATFSGLGRGAGNCPIELLLGFLKNPKYNLRPVLKFIQEYINPLKEELSWGFDIPYMLTGQLNVHPKSAMCFLDSNDKKNLIKFYDYLTEEG
ncbi:UNVERIFIED_CONTAM: 4-hydroxy 2-oxovalerate aldolase [Acetivibrio alkalicellulosi]